MPQARRGNTCREIGSAVAMRLVDHHVEGTNPSKTAQDTYENRGTSIVSSIPMCIEMKPINARPRHRLVFHGDRKNSGPMISIVSTPIVKTERIAGKSVSQVPNGLASDDSLRSDCNAVP